MIFFSFFFSFLSTRFERKGKRKRKRKRNLTAAYRNELCARNVCYKQTATNSGKKISWTSRDLPFLFFFLARKKGRSDKLLSIFFRR